MFFCLLATVLSSVDPSCPLHSKKPRKTIGQLRPSDLPSVPNFMSWSNTSTKHTNIHFGDKDSEQVIAEGNVTWEHLSVTSGFSVLPGLVRTREVEHILGLVNSSDLQFDTDPDTVDQMTSHEFYVFQDQYGKESDAGQVDADPVLFAQRRSVRKKLQKIMMPIIENRINVYLKHRFKECQVKACVPCSSLIRRYRPGERNSHGQHRDGPALVTVVVALADHGRDFSGPGLYISTGRNRYGIAAAKGDTIVHQSDLEHGVEVIGERWSWILWYRDTKSCEMSSAAKWSRDCAKSGNPICEYMYAWRMHLNPQLSERQALAKSIQWFRRSANHGYPQAMFQLAKNRLESEDLQGAKHWLRRGIEKRDADASYYMAQLLIMNSTGPNSTQAREAVFLLEDAAQAVSSPETGATYAMYNLGIAHLFGYGGLSVNATLAAEWFEASGLPEGLMSVSFLRKSAGYPGEAQEWKKRAERQGFGISRTQTRRGVLHIWPGPAPRW